jgi:hypothetical protein
MQNPRRCRSTRARPTIPWSILVNSSRLAVTVNRRGVPTPIGKLSY